MEVFGIWFRMTLIMDESKKITLIYQIDLSLLNFWGLTGMFQESSSQEFNNSVTQNSCRNIKNETLPSLPGPVLVGEWIRSNVAN